MSKDDNEEVTIDDLINDLVETGEGWVVVQSQPGSLDVGFDVTGDEDGELTLCPVYTLTTVAQQQGVMHVGVPFTMGLFLDDVEVSYPNPTRVLRMQNQSEADRRRIGGLVRKAEAMRLEMHAEASAGIKLVHTS